MVSREQEYVRALKNSLHLNQKVFAGKNCSNSTDEERKFYFWLNLGREIGGKFRRECIHRGWIPLFLRNEILIPFSGSKEIPAMRVHGTAEAYEKDILAIMQKFTEFDEYGPVYSHADDDPNLSHAEIQRREAAVLKSFSYVVKKEFDNFRRRRRRTFARILLD